MRIIPQSDQNRPMPEQTLPVLYWSESVQGWWPKVSHLHRACGGGWLRVVPPGTVTREAIGWISCDNCSQDVAEVRNRRRTVLTPEQWAALPNEHGKRWSKVAP